MGQSCQPKYNMNPLSLNPQPVNFVLCCVVSCSWVVLDFATPTGFLSILSHAWCLFQENLGVHYQVIFLFSSLGAYFKQTLGVVIFLYLILILCPKHQSPSLSTLSCTNFGIKANFNLSQQLSETNSQHTHTKSIPSLPQNRQPTILDPKHKLHQLQQSNYPYSPSLSSSLLKKGEKKKKKKKPFEEKGQRRTNYFPFEKSRPHCCNKLRHPQNK